MLAIGNAVVTLIGALTAEESEDSGGSRFEPPIGVLTLAAVLRGVNIPTSVIDLNWLWTQVAYSPEQLFRKTINLIHESNPQILGLSTICSTYPLTLRLATEIKREFPQIPIVMGGPQASVVDVATMEAFSCVDFVLRGEAEETLPIFIDSILASRSVRDLPGLTLRKNLQVHRNANAPPIIDLDKVPLPSFDMYSHISEWPSLPLEIGRGCPFSCRFCSTNDFFRRRFRLKSISHILKQMILLNERYGTCAFELIHDMFTVDRRRVAEFCDALLAIGSPFSWSCSARTDCVDPELLTKMRDAGCSGIFFGIETGSPRLQRIIDKGLDLDQSRAVLGCCDRLGVETTASLIIGYPDETYEDLQQTLAFVGYTIRLDLADPQLHILSPLAETPLETEFRSRLTFEELTSDIPDFGAGQDSADRLLIRDHPSIFSNFYAFPCKTNRAFLRQTSEFFISLNRRCKGLLIAILEYSKDPLELFEEWHKAGDGHEKSSDYYRRLQFLKDFLAFVESFYVGRGSIGIDVMFRFYAALMSTDSTQHRHARNSGGAMSRQGAAEGLLGLASDITIITVSGDVVKVLACLKKGKKPGPECLNKTTTLSVRKSRNGRSIIEELSPLMGAILAELDKSRSVSEIVNALTINGLRLDGLAPTQFVPEAMMILECRGFVRGASV